MPKELLTANDVAPILGVSRKRVLNMALKGTRRGDFPEPYAVTPGHIRLWHRADVERWKDSRLPGDNAPGRARSAA
jgi:predicted DNA-binding transcriptional regulator AlpA